MSAVDLKAHAARLYPDADYLQHEWIRAVRVVRATSGGWLLDTPAVRAARRPAKSADPGPFPRVVRG